MKTAINLLDAIASHLTDGEIIVGKLALTFAASTALVQLAATILGAV
jgi:hypothetical protein